MATREIEFRAKSRYDNKWVFGFYSPRIVWPTLEQIPNIKNFKASDIEIDIDTLGQYTERKDKNGNKIFDGDIIIYTNNQNGVYEIGRKMKGFIVFDRYNQCYISKNNFQKDMYWQYAEDVEVIGNLYDNLELLEMKK